MLWGGVVVFFLCTLIEFYEKINFENIVKVLQLTSPQIQNKYRDSTKKPKRFNVSSRFSVLMSEKFDFESHVNLSSLLILFFSPFTKNISINVLSSVFHLILNNKESLVEILFLVYQNPDNHSRSSFKMVYVFRCTGTNCR